jgi:N-acetylmuramoyl-L-alanine amidase
MGKPIVVLDPGHGGHDSGAADNGLREKDIVLDIALRVGNLLESRGATIEYTRNTDVFIQLSDRANIANDCNADYFVSLHANSADSSAASGFESFIYSGVNGGQTAAYQNVIHRRISAVFDAEGVVDRGQKKADFAVLRETNMAAVLIEYGFISSSKDSNLLKNNTFLDDLAKATADGIADVLGLGEPETCQVVDDWVEVAQRWVTENGISDGQRPTDNVTRQEVWAMLHNLYNKLHT